MSETQKSNPRWVGVLLALFLPGSAHYLSGNRKAGLIWLGGLLSISCLARSITAFPSPAIILIGLSINFLILPLAYLFLLVRSYRPVRRLRLKGWLLFVLSVITFNMVFGSAHDHFMAHPFKVPTGAMEPTVRGVTVSEGKIKNSFLTWLKTGQRYEAYTAGSSGRISNIRMTDSGIRFQIGDTEHTLPRHAAKNLTPLLEYMEGDVIWSGIVTAGDQIMVSKLAYLFSSPERGDIVVFRTAGIDHEFVRQDTVYIKRIVGLPGETIRVEPPHIVVDGQTVKEPEALGMLNYQNAGLLKTADDQITLGQDEYLVFGDNTAPNMSLDGRFFGAIPRDCIIGKVRTIYWPLNRIGPVQ